MRKLYLSLTLIAPLAAVVVGVLAALAVLWFLLFSEWSRANAGSRWFLWHWAVLVVLGVNPAIAAIAENRGSGIEFLLSSIRSNEIARLKARFNKKCAA